MLWSSALQVVTSQAGCSSAWWDPFLGKWREINPIASSFSIQTLPMWIQFVSWHSHTHTQPYFCCSSFDYLSSDLNIYIFFFPSFPIIFFRVVQTEIQGPRGLKAAWTKALQPIATRKASSCVNCHRNRLSNSARNIPAFTAHTLCCTDQRQNSIIIILVLSRAQGLS